MTSEVKVSAHLMSSKEVHVRIRNKITNEVTRDRVLQDGENETFHVYDNLEIVISEIEKDRDI